MGKNDEMREIFEGMLSTTMVARLLGVHPNTVRHWADQGLLHAARLGPRRDRRFTREELTRFIKSNGNERD